MTVNLTSDNMETVPYSLPLTLSFTPFSKVHCPQEKYLHFFIRIGDIYANCIHFSYCISPKIEDIFVLKFATP